VRVSHSHHNAAGLRRNTIRLLIANPTRVLRDVLYGTARREPDLEVAGEVSDEDTILAVAELTEPDCLVIALEQSGVPMEFCRELLGRNRRARILAISEGIDIAALCWWSEGDVRCTYMKASRANLLSAMRDPLF
jgi:DNA-binding NarL/FixJ family response regulator